jgi:glucosamine--fructose-6-phosphate aminotransferase (isomerizing)
MYLEDNDLVVCNMDDTKANADDCFEIRSMVPQLRARSSDAPANVSFASQTSDSEIEDTGKKTSAQSPMKKSRLDKGIARMITKKQNVFSEKVERDLHQLELSLEKIEKGGHKHFMIKEILEQPRVLRDCMRGRIVRDPTTNLAAPHLGGMLEKMDRIVKAKRIIITACGTSWHSAMVAEYMIESLAKVPVEVEYASEFRYRNPIIYPEDVVCAISQSGETADTLEAVRIAKDHGALALGFVNVVGSSIARLTDAGAYLHVGPEIGVASTKAFCGQVTVLALFAVQLGLANGNLSAEKASELLKALEEMPENIEKVLRPEMLKEIQETAKSYRYATNFLFLGRGPNMPVALEGALKLKEISYIHAEGYPAAELKHGPIALIDRLMPVVIIAPRFDSTYEKVKSSVEEVVARSGSVIVITDEGNHELDAYAEVVLRVPGVNEFVSPLITCVPLQLLAYYIADLRGCPIDQPRNLAKSVTVE